MNELVFRALFSGLMFGIWPLMMNRSGLQGSVSSVSMIFVSFVVVLPFALRAGVGSLSEANWKMAVASGVIAAIGMLSFNSMLAKATKDTVGLLFVVMIVAQTTIPAIHHILVNGISTTKTCGFLAAILAAILLAI